MQGTVGFTTFTTWPFWVCAPREAPDVTTFTTLTRGLIPSPYQTLTRFLESISVINIRSKDLSLGL